MTLSCQKMIAAFEHTFTEVTTKLDRSLASSFVVAYALARGNLEALLWALKILLTLSVSKDASAIEDFSISVPRALVRVLNALPLGTLADVNSSSVGTQFTEDKLKGQPGAESSMTSDSSGHLYLWCEKGLFKLKPGMD